MAMPTEPLPSASSHPLRGIALVLLAVAIFASMDAAGKHLLTKFNVPLVAGVRYGINLILLALIMGPRHGARLWHTRRTGLVILRGLSLAAATLFAGLALQRMPVGETVAILYLQGFGIMLAAGFWLKERVGGVGWLGAAIGFLGVLLIARPGGALAPMGVIYALIGAAVSVVYILLSRLLAASETTLALLFHSALAGAVVFGLVLAVDRPSYSYTPRDISLLGFIGVASLGGHYLLTSAYRFAPASFLAPFNYFHIAFAALFGWLVYSHMPDALSLTGMAMIGAAGAAVALHAHLTRARAAPGG